MVYANAIAGDYSGNTEICIGTLWSGPKSDKFYGINFLDAKGIKYEPANIKRVVHLSTESSKSFAGAAVTGIAGGLLLGGAGLIAGALVGGRKKLQKTGIEFNDGRKVIIEQTSDNKAFQCLILYAKEKGIFEQELGF